MKNSFEISLNGSLAKNNILAKSTNLNIKGNYTVLIHGLFPSALFMKKISETLEKRGYYLVNVTYPTRQYSIDIIVEQYIKRSISECCVSKKRKINFVTHSLGGILLRKYLITNTIPNLGRVVMFAPPNHGSKMSDFFKNNLLYKWFFGPAGQQLGTSKNSYVNLLPNKVNFDLGVIAGSKSYNPISYFIMDQKNDGAVSVNSTKIIGMKDHITIPTCHTCLLYDKEAIKQMLFFLDNGYFDK